MLLGFIGFVCSLYLLYGIIAESNSCKGDRIALKSKFFYYLALFKETC